MHEWDSSMPMPDAPPPRICKKCGSEVPEEQAYCTKCGKKYKAKKTKADKKKKKSEKVTEEGEKGATEEAPQPRICLFCGCELDALQQFCPKCGKKYGKKPVNRKKRRRVLAVTLSVASVFLLTAGIMSVILFAIPAMKISDAEELMAMGDYDTAIHTLSDMKENEEATKLILSANLSKAEDFIEKSNYTEAIELLEGLESTEEVSALLQSANIGKAEALLNNEEYGAAIALLKKLSNSGEAAALLTKAYEGYEKAIYAQMESGDYVKANTMLQAQTDLINYQKIHDEILYESHILQCLQILKEASYAPDSIRLNSAEIYQRSESVAIILSASGQSKVGYNNTNYCLYTNLDGQWSDLGVCTSLTVSDNFSFSDRLTAAAILALKKDGEKINAVYDRNRINRLLSANASLNVNVTGMDLSDNI